jgi:NAD(P)H dehydrogenase (quinone)
MKILVVFYSMYGHIYKMAEAVAEGVKEVKGAEVKVLRVPETLSDDILKKMGAYDIQKKYTKIDVCAPDDLVSADAVIFGTPTRFGNSTWRAGINHSQFPHDIAPPGYDYCRFALCF